MIPGVISSEMIPGVILPLSLQNHSRYHFLPKLNDS
jgi:hypothetical protein